jgi:Mg2+-importing ATPase
MLTTSSSLSTRPQPNRRLRQPLPVVEYASRDIKDVFLSLNSAPEGLNRVEAMVRRARLGLNEIAHEKPPRWYVQLLLAFHNPFSWLLLVLAAVSLFTEDFKVAVVIGVMVLISGLLRFVQEFRSNQAAQKLRALVDTRATVSRPHPRTEVPPEIRAVFGLKPPPEEPKLQEVPIAQLVPGDVVHLSAGDLVPADVRLFSTKDLFVSQATLLGESLPIEKTDAPAVSETHGSPLDLPNACFMGTTVVSGTARAIVVATGDKTYFGALARHVVGRRPVTSFDKGVNRVSWLLIRFMLVMVPIVFFLNGFTKDDWLKAFLFGISVAVGLTPEMLPMIVTANLARGAVKMSRQKVIVKQLSAIQNFGAMDVLCTDKTGTLTQDKVALILHLNVQGQECEEVFEYAFLNSHFQTGLKNLLDRAVLEHENLVETRELTQRFVKCDEVPFDFNRRRMSVVVHEIFKGRDLLICKGAVEEVLGVCTHVRLDGVPVPLTEAVRAQARSYCRELNEDGLRVIAVAFKQVDSLPGKQYGVADESGLTLIGYVSFLDPPKETAAPALAALRRHGVAVKILTGDNEQVARKVCKEVGLTVRRTVLGRTIDGLSDAELEQDAVEAELFARLTPMHKARVIAALKRRGHTVGFLGDGINDAPALREADVGISVDTGTDIAREAAQIILLEKSLLVLEQGVLVGRAVYGNIMKYLKMAASSNFGNVLSVLVASAFLPFLPMLPIMLLVQNLLYDLSQTAMPFDRVDEDYLENPRPWLVGDIGRFMLFLGPISSIFDLTTFALLYYGFGANTVATQALFQSGWFIEGLLSQTLIIHMIRTARVPFFQSTAAAPLMALSLLVMAVGIMVPFSPLGDTLGMVPLPWSFFPWLLATLVSYCILTQVLKRWYIRRFGMWL